MTQKHSQLFIGFEFATVACLFVVGFGGLHVKLGWLCILFLIALVVWSSILLRRHRTLAISGFAVVAITFVILIFLPNYIEAK
jgi:hypothetical protein